MCILFSFFFDCVDVVDLYICVSGKFVRSQRDMESLLEKHGAQIKQTVTNNVNYLVAEAINTSKANTAQQKDIAIVTEVSQSVLYNVIDYCCSVFTVT